MVGAALLAFFLARGGSGSEQDGSTGQAEPGADTLVRIDPSTDKIASSMPVGRAASGVAADDRYVWVTSFADGTLRRIDPQTGDALAIPAGGNPTGVATGSGGVLVANSPEHNLAVIDPAGAAVSYNVQLPGSVGTIPVAADGTDFWFADAGRQIVGAPGTVVSSGGTTAATADQWNHFESEAISPVRQGRTSLAGRPTAPP